MKANNKKHFIKAWNDNIDNLNILAFCNDKEISDEIYQIKDKLKELVLKVAETKKW